MNTSIYSSINFSSGKDKFDNTPLQLSAENFDDFETAILSVRSQRKGETYFSGPLSYGPHDRTEEYPESAHYRLATHGLPRRFLALDFDGFKDPDTFNAIFAELISFRGFGYTTWSHTDDAPRARAVFELNRDVSRSEGIALGKSVERMLGKVYGPETMKLDKSVYQNEQPVYSPGSDAQIFHFPGKPLNVDDLMQKYPDSIINQTKETLAEVETNLQMGENGYSRLTIDSLLKVLGFIDCTDEPKWHDVSNIIARVYGESGRTIFELFSRGDYWGTPYKEFDKTEVNKKFDRSLHELKSKPIGFGIRRLIELAGLTYSDVEFLNELNFQTEIYSSTEENISSIGISFPAINKKKKPLQVMDNLVAVLSRYSVTARYNQISKQCEILIPGLTCVYDELSNTTLTTITDLAIKSEMAGNRIPEMMDAIASKNPYCPVRTYMESKPWDGIERLTQFTNQISCSNPTLATIFWRKWFIQAIAAVYEPNGISNAGVIVLTGEQGIGKTRLFKDLTSGITGVFLEGQTLNPADKDSVMSVVSHWIVELGELDSTFRKADIAQLKAFITKTTDTLRRPYARKDSIFHRRTVFAGTVNDFQFLHDSTGNRRFWPIDVVSIKRDATIDYQQLWAEAKSWYGSNESWHLDDSELAMLNQYSETFTVSDPDVEVLLSHYPFIGCTYWIDKLMKNICEEIGIVKPTKSQMMRLAATIKKFNGNQKPRASNGLTYHYVPDTVAIAESAIKNGKNPFSGTSGTKFDNFKAVINKQR